MCGHFFSLQEKGETHKTIEWNVHFSNGLALDFMNLQIK